MFGRKEPEKRSIEDLFTPRDLDEADSLDTDVLEDDNDVVVVDDKVKKNDEIKPLDCFGMEESKTEKWIIKCVNFWHCIMSFGWFLFGALTFAPIIYISNKVNVIFKDKKKSLLVAIAIYLSFAVLTILFVSLRI